MNSKIASLVKKKSGIKLDVGGGHNVQSGYLCMDKRNLPRVEVNHDIEVTPYPFPKECCMVILVSHGIHRVQPNRVIDVMNEFWRIIKPEGQLILTMPYAGTQGFWQDPTAYHTWNEISAYYFDPLPAALGGKKSELYAIHKPKPWKIIRNTWYQGGNLELILEKREESK